ncbi:glycosyltransferase [Paraburkholderia kururiensis]|uniref:Glycosyltransferase n=1 Tax=Paraburkholderia kururiensis TaxID=984307 RepID=A0ABZ0WH86_9BURK|nr:glycosyltransferase [Paraburkholderia kururiensis]WQD76740.1 glycosyltransferase [Paraburkholderia kururiensis]
MHALDLFVVLYRRNPEASETLSTLSRIDFAQLGIDVEVHIWDNARQQPAPPAPGFLPFPWRYGSSPENESLAKVYNMLVRQSSRPYVVIFDQDSSVDTAFFRALTTSIDADKAEVFTPLIQHGNTTISPGCLKWIKGAALARVRDRAILPRNFTAMMSGMCISRALLTRMGPRPFDERLRLYGVDTRFCRDIARLGSRAWLTGARLVHDSALRSTTDPDAVLQRQIWLWQSWVHVFDRNLLEKLAIRGYVVWKAWRVSAQAHARGRFLQVVAEVFR